MICTATPASSTHEQKQAFSASAVYIYSLYLWNVECEHLKIVLIFMHIPNLPPPSAKALNNNRTSTPSPIANGRTSQLGVRVLENSQQRANDSRT
jgi:hypothetical protein